MTSNVRTGFIAALSRGWLVVASISGAAICSATPPTSAPGESASAGVSAASNAEPVAEFMDAYYLRTCAICDALLGAKGEARDCVHEGRGLRMCSQKCLDELARSPRSAVQRVDAAMIADQLPYYPLKVSLVNGRPLGEKPVDFIWGNRLFRAIDAAEQQVILRDPVAYIRKLDRKVIDAQTPNYGMPEKCPVQGDILPTDHKIDLVVANRMIRVCCGRCVHVVRARPYQYLTMVEYANRAAATQSHEERRKP